MHKYCLFDLEEYLKDFQVVENFEDFINNELSLLKNKNYYVFNAAEKTSFTIDRNYDFIKNVIIRDKDNDIVDYDFIIGDESSYDNNKKIIPNIKDYYFPICLLPHEKFYIQVDYSVDYYMDTNIYVEYDGYILNRENDILFDKKIYSHYSIIENGFIRKN